MVDLYKKYIVYGFYNDIAVIVMATMACLCCVEERMLYNLALQVNR